MIYTWQNKFNAKIKDGLNLLIDWNVRYSPLLTLGLLCFRLLVWALSSNILIVFLILIISLPSWQSQWDLSQQTTVVSTFIFILNGELGQIRLWGPSSCLADHRHHPHSWSDPPHARLPGLASPQIPRLYLQLVNNKYDINNSWLVRYFFFLATKIFTKYIIATYWPLLWSHGGGHGIKL